MFEDILGTTDKVPEKLDVYHGCPFCGDKNIEEDGPGTFPNAEQFNQPMVCNNCDGRWTIEYDEELEIKNVNRKV